MTHASAPSTVFVVDDDRGMLRLIEKTLRREGFATASAASGREAMAWLASHHADLMLLDLKLEDLPGKELILHLSNTHRPVPFLVITGQGDERVAVDMMKQGAMDYVMKDVDFLQRLPEVVRRALDQIDTRTRLAVAEAALKKEHAFIATVLDTSAGLTIVLDREGRIVRFNRACERAMGYSFEEVRGRRCWDLFLPTEEADVVKELFGKLLTGDVAGRHENYWRTKDGRRRLIAWSHTALPHEPGQIEYVIASGIDITEHKQLEKEVLEISEREQRRIGQDLHDGLGQHLTGIELMIQVLEQRLATARSKEAKKAAQAVGDIARHVREAISQARLLARGLCPVVIESEGLMAALHQLAVHAGQMYRIRCAFECDPPVLVSDHAVATHLYRIAQEALSNAVKHGKSSKVSIQLQTVGERTLLMIKDNGVGFPKVLPSDRGMGLRIMQYRAGMIGGSLAVQHDLDGGTSVICSLRSAPLETKPPS